MVWGTGLPGSGKTILSAISTRRLQETFEGRPGIAVAYAFLRYSEPLTITAILASLVHQVLRRNTHLNTRYLAPNDPESSGSATQKDLCKCLTGLASMLESVYIVVDGLDEVSDEVKEGILSVLPTIQNVKMLVMSRPLDRFCSKYTPSALRVTVRALAEDIGTYVRRRLESSSRLNEIIANDTSLVNEITSRIETQSHGMFLVARLQMHILEHKPNTRGGLRKVLEKLPASLDEMYDLALRRIEASSEDDASLAKRVIAWLLNHQGDAFVGDVQHAMAISLDEDKYDPENVPAESLILSACIGLVEFQSGASNGRQTAHLVHHTTSNYFAEKFGTHEILNPTLFRARSCLVFLISRQEDLRSYATRRYIDPLLGFRAQDMPPFLEYAYYNWRTEFQRSYETTGAVHPSLMSLLSDIHDYPIFPFFDDYVAHSDVPCAVNGLHLAAMYGLDPAIAAGTLPCRADTTLGITPFHLAAVFGHLSSLCALVGAYGLGGVLVPTSDGRTLLHLAIVGDAMNVLNALVEMGSATPELEEISGLLDINAQTVKGVTPLMKAAERAPWNTALQTLLGRPDILVNLQDASGQTALIRGVQCAEDWSTVDKIVALALHPTTDINIQDHAGWTALMYACLPAVHRRNGAKLVNLFLSNAQINIHLRNNEGRNALDIARRTTLTLKKPYYTNSPAIPWEEARAIWLVPILEGGRWETHELFETIMTHLEDCKAPRSDIGSASTIRYGAHILQLLLLKMWEISRGKTALGDQLGDILDCAVKASCMACISVVIAVISGRHRSREPMCSCEVFLGLDER